MNFTETAHHKYRAGLYEEALQLYTQALAHASVLSHKVALHSNKAVCYLKLQNFRKAAEECSAVLELDQKHVGALMLRAQTLVILKDYHSALFDVNRLIEINPSSNIYRSLEVHLRTQMSLAPIPEAEEESAMSEVEERESVSASTDKSQTDGSSNCNVTDGSSAVGFSTSVTSTLPSSSQASSKSSTRGWDAIPKPKGHSGLDYSRWDKVENDSSDEEDEDAVPRYLFRVCNVGIKAVK